jgi:hypothetical protein
VNDTPIYQSIAGITSWLYRLRGTLAGNDCLVDDYSYVSDFYLSYLHPCYQLSQFMLLSSIYTSITGSNIAGIKLYVPIVYNLFR